MTSANQQPPGHDEMLQQLMILVQKTQDTDSMVQTNRDVYQNFVIQVQTRHRIVHGIAQAEKSAQYLTVDIDKSRKDLQLIENALRQRANELNSIRKNIVKSHYEIFELLSELQNSVLYEHLPRWRHEQQLINNGVKIETIKLDTIQSWVEKIVEIIWRIKNQIKGLQLTLTDKPNLPFETDELDRFVVCVNNALENLILNSFVVEKQPPQVMKTNTRFQATVRFLCGNKLNVQMINPTVKALILSETNARNVIKYHKQLIEQSWVSTGTYNQPQLAQQQHQAQHQPAVGSCVDQPMDTTGQPAQLIHPTGCTSLNSVHPLTPVPQAFDQSQPHITNFGVADHHQASSNMGQQQQPMSLVDQDLSHQQQQQQQQQQKHHNSSLPQLNPQQQMQIFPQFPQSHSRHGHATQSNMHSSNHESFTEIGYNPDVPVNSKDFESSAEILNNSNILEYQESTGHMLSNFGNMQLKKIKRTEKRGTESVTDEKFILLFFTEFRLADDSFWPYYQKASTRTKRGTLLFHIMALSLPVVVIVHGNQEANAWATVTWHNAFATPDEILYKVPDKVPWKELGHVLSEKFRSCAGRGLSEQNLKYLAGKVYRNRVEEDKDAIVTWNQFSKEPMGDKSFNFWEWFHSILKLTREYLRDLWRADRIYGFVGKNGCTDLLLGSTFNEPCPVGTFILRYSETELGGITIAWVSSSTDSATQNPSLNDRVQISQRLSPTNSNANVVLHLQPYLGPDLKTRPLADRIRDLEDLTFLYPNITKHEAFQAYYTPIPLTPARNASYIDTMLVTTITTQYARSNLINPMTATHPQTNNHDQVSESAMTQILTQSSPESIYQESVHMSDVMESSYPNSYDPNVVNYNYTIQ